MKSAKMPKYFTFLCVCNPILGQYVSPIPGIDLGTLLTLLFIWMMMIDKRRKVYKLPTTLSIVLSYTVLCTCIGLTGYLYSEPLNILTRFLRYIVLLVAMIGVGFPTYFDKELYLKYLHKTTVIVAGYAMLQSVVYFLTSIKLPNTFGPTKIVDDADVVVGTPSSVLEYFYRPPSLFYEPSHASYFMTPYLCYLLFSDPDLKDKRQRKLVAFVSLGILITTSGQGLAVLSVCWGIWFMRQMKKFNMKAIVLFLILITFLIINFDLYRIVERVTTQDEFNAIDARSGGYDLIKTLSWKELILGFGFGNYDTSIYYSSLAEIIFCTGYVGLFFIFMMYFRAYKEGALFQKVLVIASAVLMAGGGIYNATSLCLYLPLLFSKDWDKFKFKISKPAEVKTFTK